MSNRVVKAARSAPSNAKSTQPAETLVSREHGDMPSNRVVLGPVREFFADQFRVSDPTDTTEYLFWAANTASVTIVEDTSWAQDVTAQPLSGSLTAGGYGDGTDRFFVQMPDGADVGEVTSITILVGSTSFTFTSLTMVRPGVAKLSDANLISLGGGYSRLRGDVITACEARPSAAKFWWTRNDPSSQRFAWDGRSQRWSPFRGGPPIKVGVVAVGGSYTVKDPPVGLVVGEYLPGGQDDRYSTFRVGNVPGEVSSSIRVKVVVDGTGEFPEGEDADAVIEQTAGILWIEPALAEVHQGEPIWHSPRTFAKSFTTGTVGSVLDELYLCPIPRRTESPLLRIGSRSPLATIRVDDEAALDAQVVSEGEVAWASSTGRLKLSDIDKNRCDPDHETFALAYLDAVLIYEGISMSSVPVGTRDPVRLVNQAGTTAVVGDGDLFIPNSDPASNTSGIVLVPDDTGTIPVSGLLSQTRANGSGLVRDVGFNPVIFGRSGSFRIKAHEFERDLPKFAFRIPQGEAHIALEIRTSVHGSRVKLSTNDEGLYAEQPLYFLQPIVQPLTYQPDVEIFSVREGPYTLTGGETVVFAVDGVQYEWSASTIGAGTHSAAAIAANMNLLVPGHVIELEGRIVIQGDDSVEIGYGSTSGEFSSTDLTGLVALGLMPSARAAAGGSWLPLSGVGLALHLSDDTDIKATSTFDEVLLSKSIPSSMTFGFNPPPLLDVPGYEDGVFFKVIDGDREELIRHGDSVLYDFDRNALRWVSQINHEAAVLKNTSVLNLSVPGVIPSTLHTSVGGGLLVDEEGTGYVDTDQFVFEDDGSSGVVRLVESVGGLITSGNRGTYDDGVVFTTPSGSFSMSHVGCWLAVGSPARYYLITSVQSSTSVSVTPEISGTSSTDVWALYEGYTGFDPSLLASVAYRDLPDTIPVVVKKITSLGVVSPATEAPVAKTGYVRTTDGLSYEAVLLENIPMGTLSSSMLIPSTTNSHFQSGSFAVQVGGLLFEQGSGLSSVSVFSDPVVGIEYGAPESGIEGEVRVGEDLLEELSHLQVYFVERPTTNPIVVEIDPTTRELNVPDALLDQDASYVEVLVLGSEAEVRPLTGALLLRNPMTRGQALEVDYVKADGSATTEILPTFVRGEVATRIDAKTYSFNPDGFPLTGSVRVWVDGRMQNYGGRVTYHIDDNLIQFKNNITSTSDVTVQYAVLAAQGGETSWTVSSAPMGVSPLMLDAGASNIILNGDYSDTILVGCMIRIGSFLTYVVDVDVDGSVTTLAINPTPTSEIGSRAPGAPALRMYTTSSLGLLDVAGTVLPIAKGSLTVSVDGDLTGYARAGHVLEIEDSPYLVAASELDGEGRNTIITLASPVPDDVDAPALRVSAQPVYPPDPSTFFGTGGVREVLNVTLHERGQPGYELTEGVDYDLDKGDGTLRLINPLRPTLPDGASLYLRYTQLKELSPKVKEGALILPRYKAGFFARTISPYSGGLMVGTYTVRNPDSFYIRVTDLSQLEGEVQSEAIQRRNTKNPHGGPVVVNGGPLDNWEYGVLSDDGKLSDLEDRDRVARSRMLNYDSLIRGFEQWGETVDGRAVGDHDGKFRFFVGKNLIYGGPGYEDDVTGRLITHLVWSDVFESYSGFPTTMFDPVVEPTTAVISIDGEVEGDAPDPWRLSVLVSEQRALLFNDVDDVVMVRAKGKLSFPFTYEHRGEFQSVWEPGSLSRLYPERTRIFTTTSPGLGAGADVSTNPGVYAFVKGFVGLDGERVLGSTFGRSIANLENPVLGTLSGVSGGVRVSERLPRARVWSYSSSGYPDLHPNTNGIPTIIAVLQPLSEVVLLDGVLDTAVFYSNGGNTPDLSSGDPERVFPPFTAYDEDADSCPQLALGKPDGTTFILGTTTRTLAAPFGGAFSKSDSYAGVFVGDVYRGCLITLSDGLNTISDDGALVTVQSDGSVSKLSIERGDTIYVIPPTDLDVSGVSDPPSVRDMKRLAKQQPDLDVGVRERSGEVVDRSLPSSDDPSLPLKEILGQKTAQPLMAIESTVDFVNARMSPVKIPALVGEPLDDSGDQQIPFLSPETSELSFLSSIQRTALFADGPTMALYPDEIATTGDLDAGVLTTDADLLPVYSSGSGVGPVREFDLMIVEVGQVGVPLGMQGIHHVGKVEANTVLTPRFVSPGVVTQFVFDNVMAHVSDDGLTGILIDESGSDTILTLTGVTLNFDSSGSGSGGLNDVVDSVGVPFPNTNTITIDVISSTTGLIIETLTIQGGIVIGGAGPTVIAAPPTFMGGVITVPAVGFVDFLALGSPPPAGPFSFRVSVDSSLAGSSTAAISTDRLTFTDTIDFRTVQPRGTITGGGVSIQGELSVLGGSWGTVNSPAEVNGGQPFTFLDAGSAGSVRVPSWEGHGDLVLSSVSEIRLSVISSSDENAGGMILEGACDAAGGDTFITNVVPASGDVENVQSGDLLVIRSGVTCGTYVIRHAVPGTNYTELFATTIVGANSGWLKPTFPRVVNSDLSPFEITIEPMLALTSSPTGYEWSTSGRIYLLVDESNLDTVVSCAYSAFSVTDGQGTFTLISGSVQDANGAALGDVIFEQAAGSVRVSGMAYLPLGSFPQPAPANNTVGHTSGTVAGFIDVTVEGDAGEHTFSSGVDLVGTAPTTDELGVAFSTLLDKADPTVFLDDQTYPIYAGVPTYLDVSGFTSTIWTAIHAVPVTCVCPQDRWSCHDGSSSTGTGFRALSGIFVEPTTYRPCVDLWLDEPHVVDRGHSALSAANVGMRRPVDYGVTSPETVDFIVRRIRRFHESSQEVAQTLASGESLYLKRTGTVTSYDTNSREVVVSGMNMTGVQAGDEFRVMSGDDVISFGRISMVSGSTMKIHPPGLEASPGDEVEIRMNGSFVPLIQSAEQLLEAAFDIVLRSNTGRADDFDVLLDPSTDLVASGVQVGDYIMVDPAGPLEGSTGAAVPLERGAGPTGDKSVPGRPEYAVGAPSELDDNRGWYVVQSVEADALTLNSTTAYGGPADDPVIFGSSTPTDQRFVLLPIVSGSTLTSGSEPQMALRPTAIADGSNSYRGNAKSIEPFAYTVFRKKSLVSEEAAQLILFLRERLLTWVEKIQGTDFGGDYYDFQDQEQASNLADETDPLSGSGLVTNLFLREVVGLIDVAPYASSSTGATALDRRYWSGDVRLDTETPAGSTDPYASFETDNSTSGYVVGSGRPLLFDQIEGVLDLRDKLRDLRFAWLRYRTDRINGTLPTKARLIQSIATTEQDDTELDVGGDLS